MKLIAYTLLDIDEQLAQAASYRVLSLFGRCHRVLRLMIAQLELLETMSPKEYQQIRLQLGNGSGQESPGFRVLVQMLPHIWRTYQSEYLEKRGLTLEQVYDSQYRHDDAYVVAECLMELDELFQKFRWHHILLIHRSIGMGAASLKGRSVELLQTGAKHRFFPQLWEIRSQMTDAWGGTYGRDPRGRWEPRVPTADPAHRHHDRAVDGHRLPRRRSGHTAASQRPPGR